MKTKDNTHTHTHTTKKRIDKNFIEAMILIEINRMIREEPKKLPKWLIGLFKK
jgi:hypothetical protein